MNHALSPLEAVDISFSKEQLFIHQVYMFVLRDWRRNIVTVIGSWYISAKSESSIYISAQEKSSFFAFTPQTKILKRKLSRRKLHEISRKFAQTTFFLTEISRRNSAKTRGETPRTFAEFLREISRRYSAKIRSHFKTVYIFVLFDLWFYVPVNNNGHVETVN